MLVHNCLKHHHGKNQPKKLVIYSLLYPSFPFTYVSLMGKVFLKDSNTIPKYSIQGNYFGLKKSHI